ncbi:MAG TPA: tRNA pseudouridine(55) synthase TruB [Planctomycetaceae bacterium]
MPRPFGLLNLDKPAGVTSRDVVDAVQRLVQPAKAGHAGTLDPLATGVLVVCVGPATRLIPFVQDGRKVYRATFRFGAASETDDVEGAVTELPDAPRPTRAAVEAALPEFVGTIEQVPPAYSAVHVGGRRAYELARKGETVELAAKPVVVYRFELIRFDEGTQELDCEIECGSGTYVRSLGRDLARRLGTAAVMTALRRTAVGPFRVEDAVPPGELTRENFPDLLAPPESALAGRPRVALDAARAAAVRNGRALPLPAGLRLEESEPVTLLDETGRLVAVAAFDPVDATLRPRLVFPPD